MDKKLFTTDESIFSAVEMLHSLICPASACLIGLQGRLQATGWNRILRDAVSPGVRATRSWCWLESEPIYLYIRIYAHIIYVFKFCLYTDIENAVILVFSGG